MLKGMEPILRGIGKVLRTENDAVTREPLPQRWVDLIRHLNEREQQEAENPPAQKREPAP
jgi:hypothetical protein